MGETSGMEALAEHFVAAWNARDLEQFDRLLHPDFRWHIAVTDYDEPQLRPLQSNLLMGMNIAWTKSIFDKAETLTKFSRIFATAQQFTIELRSVIAEDDRAALELVGDAINPANGRRYDNLYCYVIERHDDQLLLLREYQDTLLMFDVWVAE
jgi:ketosteroid isomerase-like protein